MELDFIMTPKFLTHHLKLLFAAHHFVFNSKDPKAIADVLCVKKTKIQYWMQSYEWTEAVSFWTGNPSTAGDLNLAERLWTEMIKNNEHLVPVDYPDVPKNIKHAQELMDASTLIRSHLFCVDNLTEDEIQDRLANEDNDGMKPVCYEGEDLENAYHWWVYPNEPEGIYSKCLARANVAGDLVIDFAGEVCLVVIRHGRLTLTRQIADDVVSIFDKRILVCL